MPEEKYAFLEKIEKLQKPFEYRLEHENTKYRVCVRNYHFEIPNENECYEVLQLHGQVSLEKVLAGEEKAWKPFKRFFRKKFFDVDTLLYSEMWSAKTEDQWKFPPFIWHLNKRVIAKEGIALSYDWPLLKKFFGPIFEHYYAIGQERVSEVPKLLPA